MQHLGAFVMTIVEASGLFAPLLFISFHLLRPLFFLPVAFICVSGGVLFGAITGSVYSIVGVTLSSLLFYKLSEWMPKTLKKLVVLKKKFFGKHSSFSTGQIALLRLVPFIHFHLISLCIIEMSGTFKEYMKTSFYSNIPLAVVYTSIGQWISSLSPFLMGAILLLLLPLFYLLRRKEVSIKWHDFFAAEGAK
ncbi:TVP38/TMEM64 family protein [Pontibacillus yanchengensis]|uniref:TVP38/TMEM64 family protein n=2 Tax=Pontibacillus yanchengensis TaxID=462910 RepID=A0ACC7VE60_9BACI|nr:VTT domain-containing protein [Pontibacillus yanchengensis]MYL34168.1 TVP38/TMEM64 family protein [Pontibacillus yanchengensis]MYL53261.1 TVP38/TMEM64 family protein [Pontibacillus yanchengensis]